MSAIANFNSEFNFSRLKQLREKKHRYTVTDIANLKKEFDSVIDEVSKVMGEEGFSEKDVQSFRESTTALGMMKTTHTQVDELEGLPTGLERKPYPAHIIESVVRFYSSESGKGPGSLAHQSLLKPGNDALASLTMPKGTNSGPILPIPGMARSQSLLVMAANAAIAAYYNRKLKPSLIQKTKGRPDSLNFKTFSGLDNITGDISRMTGMEFYIAYGERSQHTASNMPIFTTTMTIRDQHLEPKVRTIGMAPKLDVLVNRVFVKNFMESIIKKVRFHNPDRTHLDEVATKYIVTQGWHYIALDQNKFDWRHGGQVLLQLVSEVLGAFTDPITTADMMTEVSRPAQFPIGEAYTIVQKNPILSSGVSETSVVGCSGSVADLFEVMGLFFKTTKPETLIGKYFDALVYGDDVLLFINPSAPGCSDRETLLPQIFAIYESLKLKVTDEGDPAYLGYIYNRETRTFELRPYRYFQTAFFPERKKAEALWHMAIAMKLTLYKSAPKTLLKATTRLNFLVVQQFGWEVKPESFYLGGIESPAFKEGVIWASKHANDIMAMDDILYSTYRGYDIQDIEDLLGIPSEVKSEISMKAVLEDEIIPKELKDILRHLLALVQEGIDAGSDSLAHQPQVWFQSVLRQYILTLNAVASTLVR